MSTAAREVTWTAGTNILDLNSRRASWMLNDGFPGQGGSSIVAVFKRFEDGIYTPADIEAVFRIGLIGGGLSETESDALVFKYVRGQPLAPLAPVAFGLVTAVFMGIEHADASA